MGETMDKTKIKRLRERGWTVGGAEDFLDLDADEIEFVELKLDLAASIRNLRESKGMTQAEFAKAIGSSQSRVAKMESADSSVTMDLMVKSLLKVGARRTDIAQVVKPRGRSNRKTA